MRLLDVILGCLTVATTCLAQVQNWKEIKPTTSPPARAGSGMVYDIVRQRTVVFGGDYGRTRLSDTWEWDRKNWIQIKPTTSPAARFGHEMAYDLVRQRTVMFGGRLSDTRRNPFHLVADTWEYDGKNWIQIKPQTSPPARYQYGMAYDLVRQRTVLFGGIGNSFQYLGDTWEYDGKNWTQIRPKTSPPSRADHGMVYDIARQRTVLFGPDTWEYDGKNWTQIKTATTPYQSRYVKMAYDSVRQRTVLFGGMVGRIVVNHIWEYDGKNWTWLRPTTSPSPRIEAGIAFDSARRRTIVFGGMNGSYPTADTWGHGAPQLLTACPPTLSIATGGRQTLTLCAGGAYRNRLYWMLGSMTGTMPGVVLTGIHIPLNPDPYTDLVIGLANGKEFKDFKGTLSWNGTGTAALNVPAKLPIPVGFKLYHAFVVYDGTTGQVFTSSNPVSVEFK
jgi:Galactose oxidase, central domain